MTTPRLRMFAGPNGSGKSTINRVVPPSLLGTYLNPDDLEKDLGVRGFLDATDDPAINIARVQARVRQGGHDVPVDKIISRYARSLDLLLDAIRASHRAYLFDNSQTGGEHLWIAEITGGHDMEILTPTMPSWFQRAVWNKIGA